MKYVILTPEGYITPEGVHVKKPIKAVELVETSNPEATEAATQVMEWDWGKQPAKEESWDWDGVLKMVFFFVLSLCYLGLLMVPVYVLLHFIGKYW